MAARGEHLIPADAARPPAQWRKSLKEEWAQRTGKRRARPHRPRHSVEEYRRIFAAINDPRVDPRIRLAIELAAEMQNRAGAPMHASNAGPARRRA